MIESKCRRLSVGRGHVHLDSAQAVTTELRRSNYPAARAHGLLLPTRQTERHIHYVKNCTLSDLVPHHHKIRRWFKLLQIQLYDVYIKPFP